MCCGGGRAGAMTGGSAGRPTPVWGKQSLVAQLVANLDKAEKKLKAVQKKVKNLKTDLATNMRGGN